MTGRFSALAKISHDIKIVEAAFFRVKSFLDAVPAAWAAPKHTEDAIAARYRGQVWCDATERRLSKDLHR
jgi:hypothetical protein